jgi:hypothetical protein
LASETERQRGAPREAAQPGTHAIARALRHRQEADMGKTPRNLPDDPRGGREKRDEDVGEGLDNEGRPRDPDKGDAHIPVLPPPD